MALLFYSSEDSSDEEQYCHDQKLVDDIAGYLPLSLQDFCLISIISELDSYPIDILAMLPRHLRHHLLSNLPNYDLNRLDHTDVAEGIDTEKIWKQSFRAHGAVAESHRSKLTSVFDSGLHATLFMGRQDGSTIDLAYLRNFDDAFRADLAPELAAATMEKPCKEQYFLMLMWNIVLDVSILSEEHTSKHGLMYYPEKYEEAIDGITSVLGHDFLVQLPDVMKELPDHQLPHDSDMDKYKSVNLDSYRRLWKKQATPLVKFKRYSSGKGTHVVLVPKCLLPIHQSSGPLELLNHMVIGCGLQPLNLEFNAEDLNRACCNLRAHYSASEDCLVFLKSLVSKAVILALKEVSDEQSVLLQLIFESVVGNRNTVSTLKALEMCSSSDIHKSQTNIDFLSPYLFTLPSSPLSLPHYQGLSVLEFGSPLLPTSVPQLTALIKQQHSLEYVSICLLDSCQDQSDEPALMSVVESNFYKALVSLFNHEHFQFLKIKFFCKTKTKTSRCHTHFPFTELLQSFMLSHCTCNQTLYFESIPPKVPLPLTIDAPSDTVPECGSQHKILLYEFLDMNIIVPALLRLPIIRLREFAFNSVKGNQSLFHQVAQHRDLNVTKLLINFGFDTIIMEKTLSTICHDFERLFGMPTLNEVFLCGEWLNSSEIKSAIVIGLQQQAQICSLKKICLKHNTLSYLNDHVGIHYGYTETEFREFWNAIFSLPHVDQLELELNMKSRITIHFIDMAHVICKCWKQFSFEKKKLKLLQLSLHEEDFDNIRGADRLEQFKPVTHNLKVIVNYYRKDSEIFNYFKT